MKRSAVALGLGHDGCDTRGPQPGQPVLGNPRRAGTLATAWVCAYPFSWRDSWVANREASRMTEPKRNSSAENSCHSMRRGENGSHYACGCQSNRSAGSLGYVPDRFAASRRLTALITSSRRVKKGPGRRPQSAKRQRFMESRARGWSVRAAAREVGVSRSSGTIWARGHNVYRNGVVVGFVAPLDRLTVREISSRYLSQDERIKIADLRKSGLSLRTIAVRLGRAPSTISRELRRNSVAGRGYRPFDARRRATVRRARHHRRRVETNHNLGTMVAELLLRRWSPQQISRHLRHHFPDDLSMRLCHESIYQAVYQPNSRLLRPSRLAHHRQQRRRGRFQQPMLGIHDRPFPAADRSEAGHWEGDLIIGDNTSRRSAPSSNARPGWCAWCTCFEATPTRCTPP